MPTSAADTEIAYIGNGATVAYPFPFEVAQASHFEATIDGVVVTDYTLSGLGVDSGGTCTFSSAPASLAAVVLARIVPYARSAFDYQEGGELAAATLDADIDDENMQIQQLATVLKRVPKVARGNLTAPLDLVPEASKLLAWDGAGLGLTNVDAATVTPASVVMSTVGQQLVTAASKPALMAYIGSQSHGIANCALSFSVNAGALTVALKGHDGSDLSANSQAFVAFRSATAASGDMDVLEVTAALSITVPSGATMGVQATSEPFRVWVVLFNDASVVRLGLIKPLGYNVASLYTAGDTPIIYPLAGSGLATASAISGGSDFAGNFYAGTTIFAASPYTVLGYFEYSAGLAALGVWNIVPTGAALWRPGLPLPGDVVQRVRHNEGEMLSGATALPFDDTRPSNTEGNLFLSVGVTSVSRPNLHQIRGCMNVASTGAAAAVAGTLCEGTTTDALAVVSTGRDGSANSQALINIDFSWVPTMAAPAYQLRAGNSAGTITLNGSAAARQFGGRMVSFIDATEIMV